MANQFWANKIISAEKPITNSRLETFVDLAFRKYKVLPLTSVVCDKVMIRFMTAITFGAIKVRG